MPSTADNPEKTAKNPNQFNNDVTRVISYILLEIKQVTTTRLGLVNRIQTEINKINTGNLDSDEKIMAIFSVLASAYYDISNSLAARLGNKIFDLCEKHLGVKL